MNQIVTKGIVLKRTNFGEADRIVTLLTADHGKLRLMARGVRKVKSKLAGGIELFSVSDITYINGKGDIGTLISSRLDTHYGQIVKDIDRVQLGYEVIKQLDKATEDHPESAYFNLLQQAFAALNDPEISLDLIQSWFQAQLLQLAGHTPNLATDTADQKLSTDQNYNFDFEAMAFMSHKKGKFHADHIKLLRLLFSQNPLRAIAQVQGIKGLLADCAPLMKALTSTLRI